MYKLIVMTDLDRLSGAARDFANKTLDRLVYDRQAMIIRVPAGAKSVRQQLFDDCDGIIVRPTDSIKISRDLFANNTGIKHIFTVSEGINHLKEFADDARFKIVNLPPDRSNNRGVALINMLLVHSLLCRIPININNIDLKSFKCTTEQTNYVDKTWLLLGAGKQTARLLEFSHLSGVRKFIVWNNPMLPAHIDRCLEALRTIHGERLEVNHDAKTAIITFPPMSSSSSGKSIEFEFVSDVSASCATADIISIHVPLTETSSNGRAPTRGMINGEFIRKFNRSPILINTARGEILNEQEVFAALTAGRLAGVAVDVLPQDIERHSIYKRSRLWSERTKSQETLWRLGLSAERNCLNLIITPHIAGSVDNDNLPMWEFLADKLKQTISDYARTSA